MLSRGSFRIIILGDQKRSQRIFYCFAISCMVCCTSCGCSEQPTETPTHVATNSATNVEQHSSAADSVFGSETISHNFGVVRPGEVESHCFVIKNNSSRKWTFSRVKNTCSCTAVAPTFEAIDAGGTGELTVNYRASQQNRDDQKVIRLYFKEPEAPIVILDIRASIREEMSFTPPSLEIYVQPQRATSEHVVEIENFSDSDWGSLSVLSHPGWVSCQTAQIVPSMSSGHGYESRQRWRMPISMTPSNLDSGQHEGLITLSAKGASTLQKDLRILIRIQPALVAIPARLFFAGVSQSKHPSQSIILRVSNEFQDWSAEDFHCRSNLGDNLRVSFVKSDRNTCQLSAEIVDSERTSDEERPLMHITFSRSPETELAIPLILSPK